MGKLDTKERKHLSDKTFGLPKERKYPMPDKSHARNAKARASEEEKKGHISAKQKARIDRKADKVLGHPKSHAEFEKLGR